MAAVLVLIKSTVFVNAQKQNFQRNQRCGSQSIWVVWLVSRLIPDDVIPDALIAAAAWILYCKSFENLQSSKICGLLSYSALLFCCIGKLNTSMLSISLHTEEKFSIVVVYLANLCPSWLLFSHDFVLHLVFQTTESNLECYHFNVGGRATISITVWNKKRGVITGHFYLVPLPNRSTSSRHSCV